MIFPYFQTCIYLRIIISIGTGNASVTSSQGQSRRSTKGEVYRSKGFSAGVFPLLAVDPIHRRENISRSVPPIQVESCAIRYKVYISLLRRGAAAYSISDQAEAEKNV